LEDHWRSIEKSTRAVTRLIYWDYRAFHNPIAWSHIDFIHAEIVRGYIDWIRDLADNPPVRTFIYDGPLFFVNHYRQGWTKEIMEYITKKVMAPTNHVSIVDPFDFEDRVPLLWRNVPKGEDFFTQVRKIEAEKDRDRKSWLFRD
jgi:hypothetical protein